MMISLVYTRNIIEHDQWKYEELKIDQKEEDDDGLSWFDCILIQQETVANYRGIRNGSCGTRFNSEMSYLL